MLWRAWGHRPRGTPKSARDFLAPTAEAAEILRSPPRKADLESSAESPGSE